MSVSWHPAAAAETAATHLVTVRRRPALRYLLAAAACGCGGLLVTACASSSVSGSSGHMSGVSGQSAGASRASAPVAGPVYGDGGTDEGAANPGTTGQGASPATDLAKLAPAQSIVYTAELALRVKNVSAIAATASADVIAVGGYVASEQETAPAGKHGTGQVSLEVKIPAPVYQTTLAKLALLGHQLSFSTQADDVTQQVADVGSRVASAQAAIKQLRALLSRAGNVGQLLSVQNEINSEESSLEALLAQQQALSHETSYGTVTLTLSGHHAAPVKKHKKKARHGLVAGLATGWRALKVVVVWLLMALGTILPFAIPVVLIGGAVYVGRRRIVKRRTPPAPTPSA
jgi:hypothetical protein